MTKAYEEIVALVRDTLVDAGSTFREDKKEAKRLQHALEYYRLPNNLLQENPELPEYVRPVFRDMTDLEVGELSAQIHAGLEQSHFLIVVCSPRAAASKWVNDEVEYFVSLGKQDKIVPYIIEGVPHASNPNEECFPSALLRIMGTGTFIHTIIPQTSHHQLECLAGIGCK